jgi:hypothetical protein
MWNDTDNPLAYLITFRCYGTWLHGDERGSIDRFHNRFKSPYIEPNEKWQRHNTEALEAEPVTLDASQRKSIDAAIRETCVVRKWYLHAVNVRTNHVHVVVSIGLIKTERALIASRQTPPGKCGRIVVGDTLTAHGRKRAASDAFGMNAASRAQLTMCFMGRVMNCRTLTMTEAPLATRSLPLPVLTPSQPSINLRLSSKSVAILLLNLKRPPLWPDSFRKIA